MYPQTRGSGLLVSREPENREAGNSNLAAWSLVTRWLAPRPHQGCRKAPGLNGAGLGTPRGSERGTGHGAGRAGLAGRKGAGRSSLVTGKRAQGRGLCLIGCWALPGRGLISMRSALFRELLAWCQRRVCVTQGPKQDRMTPIRITQEGELTKWGNHRAVGVILLLVSGAVTTLGPK